MNNYKYRDIFVCIHFVEYLALYENYQTKAVL